MEQFFYKFLRLFFIVTGLFVAVQSSKPAIWQWSFEIKNVISNETSDHPRAFLWIPPNCKQVRGVVVGQHNMLEEGILEHPEFRRTMTDLGFAEIWISPIIQLTFDFSSGAGDQFNDMIKGLANESGYSELEFAPVIPIGHSALASYPWNFAAWSPSRTLAILSVHGDAPLTKLTGSGRPNPDWADRNIDGVPGLMVEGEYEWWEDRVKPAFDFQASFPDAPVSFLTDAGHGHFDYSDDLVSYLCLFIRKAAQYRLPSKMAINKPVKLIPIDPKKGWLADRWHKDEKPHASAAPYAIYTGERKASFWYFDKEMANATERYYAKARGKKEQYLGFIQNGTLLSYNQKMHAQFTAKFIPETDGLTFHIITGFTDTLRTQLVREHAGSIPSITRICGPVEKVDDSTFTVRFYRMGLTNTKRTGDIWLIASNPGDKAYKSAVQQLNIKIPLRNTEGKDQHISFPVILNQKTDNKCIKLTATADSKMPVYYYVQEGPAEVDGNTLVLTPIPPRSKYPVKVTVAAWQYGRSIEPKIKSAEPVVQHFYIEKRM